MSPCLRPPPVLTSLPLGVAFPHRYTSVVLGNTSPQILGRWNPPCPLGRLEGLLKGTEVGIRHSGSAPGLDAPRLFHRVNWDKDAYGPRSYPMRAGGCFLPDALPHPLPDTEGRERRWVGGGVRE